MQFTIMTERMIRIRDMQAFALKSVDEILSKFRKC